MNRGASVFRQDFRQAIGRIGARAIALCLAPLKDHSDALEDSTGRCGPRQPSRTERRENVGAGDGIHAFAAKRLEDPAERRQPLLAVLVVLERGGVSRVDLCGRILEAEHRGAPSLGQRVAAISGDLPQPSGLLAGLSQRHQCDAAQADIAARPHNDSAEHPALRTAGCHEQVQTASVSEAPRRVQRLHLPWRYPGQALYRYDRRRRVQKRPRPGSSPGGGFSDDREMAGTNGGPL